MQRDAVLEAYTSCNVTCGLNTRDFMRMNTAWVLCVKRDLSSSKTRYCSLADLHWLLAVPPQQLLELHMSGESR